MNVDLDLMREKALMLSLVSWDERLMPILPEGIADLDFDFGIQGIQRAVFVDYPNEWIFKVPRHYSDNYSEYQNAVALRKELAEHPLYRVPTTFLMDDIIIMEYIRGRRMDGKLFDFWQNTHQFEVEDLTGLTDIHGQNVIFDGSHFYIVDLAL